jgi:thioredoxin-dependent peroxiredoxin
MLKVGDPVPDFSFSSEAFGSVSSASLRGKRYVMYFYPKDDTPGCTREACAFRDNLPRFGTLSVKVFGVSADDEKSHLRFARKHSLNFKLIPDPDHVICEAFGTWIEKSMYGRSYMGVARSTFVIGPDARVEKIWEKVSPDGHAEEVFAWLNGDPIPVPAKPAPVAKPVATVRPATVAQAATEPSSTTTMASTGSAVGAGGGKLPTGSSGPMKSTRKPAAKAVAAPASTSKPKSAASKAAVTKSMAKKQPAKPAAAGKSAARKLASKKSAAKKIPAKKLAGKKAPAKKAPAKKVVARKPAAKKVSSAKPAARVAAKRSASARKSAARAPAARSNHARPATAQAASRRPSGSSKAIGGKSRR